MAPPEGSFDGSASYVKESASGVTQRAASGVAVKKSGMPEAFVNTDVRDVRHEYIFKPPSFVEKWLRSQLIHQKDAPIAFLMFNIVVMTLPAALTVFLVTTPGLGGVGGWKGNLLGVAYLVTNYVLFMQRFMLGLHFSEHLPTFKKTFVGSILSNLFPIVIAPFFGMPPGFYRLHHVVMHHVENNLTSYDLSSTEPYQRDNFLHFVHYWFRFAFLALFEVPYYALYRRRYALLVQAICCIVPFISLLFLYPYVPIALTWCLVAPFFLSSFLMMFGNWSQHIFIDPRTPRSNYSLTYNCVNAADNQKTFNDGYHILHHLNSQIHWLDLPHKFMETMDVHAREDALIFKDIHFVDIGILVFTGQLKKLATHYVNIGQPERSEEELVAMFKERLVPIKHAPAKAA